MIKKDKIKVFQVITSLGLGGAEKVLLDLSSSIDKSKFNIQVFALSKHDDLIPEFAKIGIVPISFNANNSFLDFLKMTVKLFKFVSRGKPDIIHAHMAHALFLCVFIKMVYPKIKLIFTSHSINVGSRLRELLLFLTRPLRDVDILLSKELKQYYYIRNSILIPNGIDTNKFYYTRRSYSDPFIFVTVGRLEEVKNHILLCEAGRTLKEKLKTKFKILIVGYGSVEEKLKRFIQDNNLESCVILLGKRSDIPDILRQAHCFLLPSKWEGVPVALLEAAASGLPVIATPVGGIPSILDEKFGYLSTETLFADTMNIVVENYSEAIERAERLKQKILEEYSLEAFLSKHEELYLNILHH